MAHFFLLLFFFYRSTRGNIGWLFLIDSNCGGRHGWLEHVCLCGEDLSLKPGWSPIRELEAADVAYSQPRCVIDCSYSAVPCHYSSSVLQ